jgi:dipeptide transport system ATP-binding protein
MSQPILEVRGLKRYFSVSAGGWKKQTLHVLNGIDLAVAPHRTLGIVGESGCGKSTLGKVLMQIYAPTSGDILFHGQSVENVPDATYRQAVQMIFQDPYRSLNPRKKAIDIIAEPAIINSQASKAEIHDKARAMMEKVGLRKEYDQRYPHMFSGGQRQRIGVARALMTNPEVIVCDEAVSALDVSIQAQVLNLLMDLQDEMGMTYLFISHDLSVVRHIADEVVVMYLGKVVEQGTQKEIFEQPQHPYTQALLAATPTMDALAEKKDTLIKGELPSLFDLPKGCAFYSRCPKATPECQQTPPPLETKNGHKVACIHV